MCQVGVELSGYSEEFAFRGNRRKGCIKVLVFGCSIEVQKYQHPGHQHEDEAQKEENHGIAH